MLMASYGARKVRSFVAAAAASTELTASASQSTAHPHYSPSPFALPSEDDGCVEHNA